MLLLLVLFLRLYLLALMLLVLLLFVFVCPFLSCLVDAASNCKGGQVKLEDTWGNAIATLSVQSKGTLLELIETELHKKRLTRKADHCELKNSCCVVFYDAEGVSMDYGLAPALPVVRAPPLPVVRAPPLPVVRAPPVAGNNDNNNKNNKNNNNNNNNNNRRSPSCAGRPSCASSSRSAGIQSGCSICQRALFRPGLGLVQPRIANDRGGARDVQREPGEAGHLQDGATCWHRPNSSVRGHRRRRGQEDLAGSTRGF
ncbi:unnamed protein product [Polarella glacialis]|uniref:Uncharacterized protein n=1 Tax=Polarella glacialis TaxID=89957 RepID=A0A813D787_POLGL|nr:unnamed protein product [Polarella glacialis]